MSETTKTAPQVNLGDVFALADIVALVGLAQISSKDGEAGPFVTAANAIYRASEAYWASISEGGTGESPVFGLHLTSEQQADLASEIAERICKQLEADFDPFEDED